ncbi:hypothetical protein [Rhodoplanes elegans]|nr:hypothetical protein [Rhodoplanes elegans]
MTAQIVRKPLDWFARQRRNQDPATRHDGDVIPIEADPALIHRRALGLQVQRARRAMWPANLRCRPSAAIDTIARDAVVDLPAPSKHLGAVVCDPFDPNDAA